ncbi:hypothetical protein Q0A17_04150 [Citrobacter sp. S2-9]|uniref:Cyanophage baseplate Pam3 plug gp18 domain-containing protein n=1 Tax=Citrobacter enshiensis TaxID=2971264 RepID=A0ABT8PQT5_9ENTR|nr:hypothetical protein [Citrobacter enshiensis]MDN8598614.1 hypothetical protein [Citrobacter enshiensis]
MKIIPIEPVPNQKLNIVLSQQNCSLKIYQKSGLVYVDLAVAGTPVVYAGFARNRVDLVRGRYLHFIGNLKFVDTQGSSDPVYSGFNTRWLLTCEEG